MIARPNIGRLLRTRPHRGVMALLSDDVYVLDRPDDSTGDHLGSMNVYLWICAVGRHNFFYGGCYKKQEGTTAKKQLAREVCTSLLCVVLP